MAQERIDEIIAQEAFDQIRRLSEDLSELNNTMGGLVQQSNTLKQSISQATSYKEASASIQQANTVAQTFTATAQKVSDTQTKMASAIGKVVVSENQLVEALDKGRAGLEASRAGTDELIDRMQKEQQSIKDITAARKKESSELEKSKNRLDEYKDSLEVLSREEMNLKTDIAETRKALSAGASGTEYDSLTQKLQLFEAQLARNNEKQGEYRDKINEANTAIDTHADAVNRLTKSEIEHKVALGEVSSAAKQSIALEDNQATSIKDLQELLKNYTAEYAKLSEEERKNADIGGALSYAIQTVKAKLNEIKIEEFGQRTLSLRTMVMQLRQAFIAQKDASDQAKAAMEQQSSVVSQIAQEKGVESQEYRNAKDKLDELNSAYQQNAAQMYATRDALVDLTQKQKIANAEVQVLADPNGGLKAMTQGLQTVAAGYNTAIGLTNMFGGDTEKLKNALAKVLLVQQTMNAATTIANNLRKTSALVIKTEVAWQKIKLALTKQNTVATTQETVTTGGLATAETVATGTSITLAGAIRAVGAAIKSIPIVGWMLAAVAVLGTLTSLVVKHITAEKELTAEEKRRKEVQDGINDARKQAIEDTQKEFIELDRSVGKIHEMKAGTEEYNEQVKAVADKLGVSEQWLAKNIDRVDELTEAWKRVRRAQALADAYVKAAADAQVKAEEKVIALRAANSDKERKKTLREQGYTRREARKMAKDIEGTAETIRETGRKTAKDYIEQADKVEASIKEDNEEILKAQKEGAKKSSKTARSAANNIKKKAESAKEYYKGIIKQMSADEDKRHSKNTRKRLAAIDKEQAREAAKYKIGQTLSEEERNKIAEYYSNKRREIIEDEMHDVMAAYAVVTEEYIKLNEKTLLESKLNGEELSNALLALEEARYEEKRRMREDAFKKEVDGLDKNSALYIATENKYRAMSESDEKEHQDNIRKIRSEGMQKSLADIKKGYDLYRSYIGINIKDESAGTIANLKKMMTENDIALRENKDAIKAYVESYRQSGVDIDEINSGLEAAARDSMDVFKSVYSLLNDEQKKAVEGYQELLDKQVELEVLAVKINNDLANEYIEMANVVSDAFIRMGDSMKDMFGESLGITIAQQALATATILFTQGVAIAKAIQLATQDSKSIPEMIAKILAAVSTVVAQFASATSAVKQSKQAISEATAYAEGTEYHHGGDAVVGEGGNPELVLSNGKGYVIDKPTLIRDMPVGSKVIPLEDNGNGIDLTDVLDAMGRIERRDMVQVNVGKNVYSYIVSGASKARILNRQFSH